MIRTARMSVMKYVTNLSKMKEINHSYVYFLSYFTSGSAVFVDFNPIFLFFRY